MASKTRHNGKAQWRKNRNLRRIAAVAAERAERLRLRNSGSWLAGALKGGAR